MAAWPADLPVAPLLGYAEKAPARAVRTPMDSGPAKVRRRFVAGVREISVPLRLTETQKRSLDAFYDITTAGGALKFTARRPRTDSAVTMRFREPYEVSYTGGGVWQVTLALEILPQ